jgi:4-hydroxybenzoate polyprenyltransferase
MTLSYPLVRAREWWDHKIPLALLLLFLLHVGHPFSISTLFACSYLIVSVSAVANYGHAINELYDREQDAKARRTNIATMRGSRSVRAVAFFSAAIALITAWFGAGVPSILLTAGALCLPTAYSVPPIRLKERMWLGVLADALAAHVYPAAMALVIAVRWSITHVTPAIIAASLTWSLMLGIRGILSHQVTSEFVDRQAGLSTVVHGFGANVIARLVLCLVLPAEIVAFAIVVVAVAPGVSFYLIIAAFTMLEGRYVFKGVKLFSFSSNAFFTFPFLCSPFYEVWAATASLVALVFYDVRFLLILPAYLLLFWARFDQEVKTTAILRIHDRPGSSAEQIAEDLSLLRRTGDVDAGWYISTYPDLSATEIDAVEHYCKIGWQEGRDPNPSFSTVEYLRRNWDVAVSGMNPLAHFIRHGQFEGRAALPPSGDRHHWGVKTYREPPSRSRDPK